MSSYTHYLPIGKVMMTAALAPTVLGFVTSKDNTMRSLLYNSGRIGSRASIVTAAPYSFGTK